MKIVGRITFYRGRPEFHHPDVFPVQDNGDHKKDTQVEDDIAPVYSEVEPISQKKIIKIISHLLSVLGTGKGLAVKDPLPEWIRKEKQFPDKMSAIKLLHQPDKTYLDEYLKFKAPAQKRLIFEEFFYFQLYLFQKKAGIKKKQGKAFPVSRILSEKLKKQLSFSLTHAQEKALQEIAADLAKPEPMQRLVQGDVGCGKTVVAFLSACQVIDQGYQCAIMAPTEILADQHYKHAVNLFSPLGVKVEQLTGKTKASLRKAVIEQLKSGEASICVGTHALIQEGVEFKNLGLVVIDEQHRFGVHQRAWLLQKGVCPHFLVMTATPIPRSLAMTLYGNLDISIIDEMPKGRIPVVTKKVFPKNREKVLRFVEEKISEGRQAYIVYPLVEESEHMDLKNAVEEFEKCKKRFTQFRCGLLHGQMPAQEKHEVMSAFVKGDIHILVSTTVIEVGVDVANASIMVVEHAERFGLSQLHQLRGRVGRGTHQSYCILVLGGFSEQAKERLSIMERTSSGFEIAEADLKIRGPGEFLGTRQSGLPEFKLANLVRDQSLLKEAKTKALQVLEKDPELEHAEHSLLRQTVQDFFKLNLPG